MNPRNTFFLVVLAAGLFAFIFFYERHRNLEPPPPPKLLAGLDAAAVTNVQVQIRGEDKINAERMADGSWQLTGRPLTGPYPAIGPYIENMLMALVGISPQIHISAEQLKGKRNVDADYGLESPVVTIVAIQRGENMHTLQLGNLTAPGNQIYARVVGSDGVDIIATNSLRYIPHQLADWRDPVFVSLQGRVFDRITVTNGSKTFTLQSDGTNSSWHIAPHERVNLVDLKNLFDQLQAIRVVQFKTDDPKADLEPFGLQPPELQLDFDEGTNHLFALQFGKSPTNLPNFVYARRDNQSTVVLIPAAQVNGWRAEKSEFRDRTLAGMYTWEPDEIDVAGHADFTIQRKTNDEWRVIAPKDFPADTNLVKQFIRNLARLSVVPTNGPIAVKDIVPPSEWTNYGLASPSWKYVLRKEITNSSGAVTNATMAEIDFGATSNNDIIFARRPEEPSAYAVALSDFRQLPDSGVGLRDRTIWNFKPNQVRRITIVQNGNATELIHKAANDWTLAPGSQGIINPLAVEVGAEELGLLAAEDFVERGDEKKAAFGFTEKSVRISVSVGAPDKPQTMEVQFGGWSPRRLQYGMVEFDGEKWIFELPATVHDRLMYYFNINEDAPQPPPNNPPAGKAAARPAVK
jgi:hypothetical protein